MHSWQPADRVRLARGVELAPADSGRWQARWDFDEVTFLEGDGCGRVLPWLAPLLAQACTVAELEQTAHARDCLAELRQVLNCLAEHNLLRLAPEAATDDDGELRSALETLTGEPGAVLDRLAAVRVVVCGRSQLADAAVRSLSAQGFSQTKSVSCDDALQTLWTSATTPVFPVVIEPDWPDAALDAFNRGALAARQPWMLVGAWNRRVLVGPIFLPGQTPCYECYRKRLDSHRRYLAAYRLLDAWRRSHAAAPAAPLLPSIADLAAAWTALEIFHHVSGVAAPRTLGRVLVYQPAEARLSVETVLRVPWCPACSHVRMSDAEHGELAPPAESLAATSPSVEPVP